MNAVYHLDGQARALCALAGDEVHNRFVIGSASLRSPNSLHVVDFDEDANDVTCVGLYEVSNEVRGLACARERVGLCGVSYLASDGDSGVEFVDLPCAKEEGGDGEGDGGGEGALKCVAHAGSVGGGVTLPVAWNPVDEGDGELRVLVPSRSGLGVVEIGGGGGGDELVFGSEVGFGVTEVCTCADWEPQYGRVVVAGVGSSLRVWDPRSSGKSTIAVGDAHAGKVAGLSFNPNRPWYVASSGEDGEVKVWDVRRSAADLDSGREEGGEDGSEALRRVYRGHTHVATAVCFNPYHDQLLLTAGSTGGVCLWRASTVSSAPIVELNDDDDEEDGGSPGKSKGEGTKASPDAVVARLSDHEDAVYSLAWSPAEPWVFASLSLQGRAVFCTVPSEEKYKVLL